MGNHQIDFFKQEFGENLKVAVLHLDESTPHLHLMVSTEIKSEKKYKNQKGEFFKTTYSLNAKRWNPEFLISLHDKNALHNKKFGLERGVQGSDRVHETVKEHYRRMAIEKANLEQQKKLVASQLDEIDSLLKFKNAYPTLKKVILDSYESITSLFDILDKKDLSEMN